MRFTLEKNEKSVVWVSQPISQILVFLPKVRPFFYHKLKFARWYSYGMMKKNINFFNKWHVGLLRSDLLSKL